jgi:hypothetical protein
MKPVSVDYFESTTRWLCYRCERVWLPMEEYVGHLAACRGSTPRVIGIDEVYERLPRRGEP